MIMFLIIVCNQLLISSCVIAGMVYYVLLWTVMNKLQKSYTTSEPCYVWIFCILSSLLVISIIYNFFQNLCFCVCFKILKKYCDLIDPIERRIEIGAKYGCHESVIEVGVVCSITG